MRIYNYKDINYGYYLLFNNSTYNMINNNLIDKIHDIKYNNGIDESTNNPIIINERNNKPGNRLND